MSISQRILELLEERTVWEIEKVERDAIEKCQQCGTRIRKCVFMRGSKGQQVIVGADCAALMMKTSLGAVNRKIKKVEQEQKTQRSRDLVSDLIGLDSWQLAKRFYSQMRKAVSDGRFDDAKRWKGKLDRAIDKVVVEMKEPRDQVMKVVSGKMPFLEPVEYDSWGRPKKAQK